MPLKFSRLECDANGRHAACWPRLLFMYSLISHSLLLCELEGSDFVYESRRLLGGWNGHLAVTPLRQPGVVCADGVDRGAVSLVASLCVCLAYLAKLTLPRLGALYPPHFSWLVSRRRVLSIRHVGVHSNGWALEVSVARSILVDTLSSVSRACGLHKGFAWLPRAISLCLSLSCVHMYQCGHVRTSVCPRGLRQCQRGVECWVRRSRMTRGRPQHTGG